MPTRHSVLPMQTRLAPVSTANVETRTVEMVWTTGAAVRRLRYSGWEAVPYDEILPVTAEAVDLSRLQTGAPVLDSHDRWSTRAQVAVVERAWLAGGSGRAVVRFPSEGVDEAADRMFALVREGIIRNVSIGYSIDRARIERPTRDGEVERMIAERWTPYEISFVTVPADAGAQTRSGARDGDDARTYPVVIVDGEEAAMPDNTQPSAAGAAGDETRAAPVTTAATAPAVTTETRVAAVATPDVSAVVAQALAADRARSAEIRSLGGQARMPADAIEAAVAAGLTVDAFRQRAFEHLAATAAAAPTTSVHVLRDEGDTRRRAMTEAMCAAMAIQRGLAPTGLDGKPSQVGDAAREYVGMSVAELAAVHLGERRMPRTFAEREAVLQRSFATASDFPILLNGALNARMLASYMLAPTTYRSLAEQISFSDFRAHELQRPSDFPFLQAVAQTGEIKYGTLSDAKKETVTVSPYGVQFKISRQVLVNDNLGGIDRMLASEGNMVAQFEEVTFYAMKGTTGPTMAETNTAMFASGHNNFTSSGTAISTASLGVGRAALRKQTSIGPDKTSKAMNLTPAILLVSPDKETEAESVLAAITPAQASQVNLFSTKLQLIVSAQMTGNAWELYTAPAMGSNWVWGLLEGYSAPRLRIEQVFGTDGVAVELKHDFGCGAQDYRFGYRNAGA